jgi:acetate kinase
MSNGNGSVLVVNTGSSSVKYALIDVAAPDARIVGRIERIGDGEFPDHASALRRVLTLLTEEGASLDTLTGVGHRIVHGGAAFADPVVVDDGVAAQIEELVPLAPLHNPPGVLGLKLMRELLPDVPHVAVFDTAFHASLPAVASTYALPMKMAQEQGIRRYGFHGTSFRYVAGQAARLLGVPLDAAHLVICHIGNGASVCAVQAGKSIDTSMGMTPLEGLVMGTRSGDLDPGVLLHLLRSGAYTAEDLDRLLNKSSGLLGLSGSSDVREVRSKAVDGDRAAQVALDIYAYRLRKYVGAFLAVVPEVQAVVFTGGVGENDAVLRSDVCGSLRHLGLRLDVNRNWTDSADARFIDDDHDGIRLLVVPTDEEAEIAAQTAELVSPAGPSRR